MIRCHFLDRDWRMKNKGECSGFGAYGLQRTITYDTWTQEFCCGWKGRWDGWKKDEFDAARVHPCSSTRLWLSSGMVTQI